MNATCGRAMLDAWCMPVCAQKAVGVTKVTLYDIVL